MTVAGIHANTGADKWWPGELPKNWRIVRAKWTLSQVKGGVWGEDAQGDEWDIPCVRIADFDRLRAEVGSEIPTTRQVEPGLRNGRLLSRGDLVIEKSGGGDNQPVGFVALYVGDQPAVCSNFTTRGQVRQGYDPSFLRYVHMALYSARRNVQHIRQTSGIQNLDVSAYLNELVPRPPLEEQCRIAAFLDHETARIDELVREQERLQVLLEEKRQAVISHAVTKGLEPSAPMKDSGVKWLGEMPAHWDTVQSRRLFSERKERASPQDIQLTVSQKYGLLPQVEFMEREGRRVVTVQRGHDILKRVYAGDFVISMRSFQGGLELAEHTGSMSSAYVPLTPIKSVHSGYFRWLFKSSSYVAALQSTSDLVRDGQAMRFENFAEVPLPVVPESEQAAIAKYLNEATTLIDELVFQAENSNRLLRERRSALISAAVTGQLDLSEWQQPKLDAVAEVA